MSERTDRVKGLADLLDCLPAQMRVEAADKLDGLGLRVNPELALPEDDVEAIAQSLYFLAVPARRLVAYQLRACGVTVNPDEATLVLEREGPAWMGNHAPKHPVKKTTQQQGMDFVQHFMPDLAEQIKNAKSEQEKAALGQQLMQRHRQASAEAEDLAAKTPPEVFE